jgi:vacuolar-type H+-ATPase subunit B/Vma2
MEKVTMPKKKITKPLPSSTIQIFEGKSRKEVVLLFLDALEAALFRRATNDQNSYEIETPVGKRALKHIPIQDLLLLKSTYLAELAQLERQEKMKNGKSAGNKIYVRF